ncbi:MAG: SDR family oxidoreductase [Chitinophagales bacterium]|nr:SDR family oxidoreductase [Chitinophagales bacterium]
MKDKVVIITGASSGIGLATAKKFAAEGCKTVLAARSVDKLQDLQAEIRSLFQTECICIGVDVTIEEDCKLLINKSIDAFGRIDILINNAGISMKAAFADLDLDVLKKVMDVNFWGTVYCSKYALPHILKSKGSIVGVSSIAGYRGLPGRTGYSASKFAMQGFLESLRTEHLYDDIHIMIFCPGYTASNIRHKALLSGGEMQGDSPRKEKAMMTAEEVADVLYTGVKKRKEIVTLTTQGKLTVFLNKWVPTFMDKLVFNEIAKEKDSPFKKPTN